MIRKNKQLIVDKNIGDCFRACMTSILGVSNSPLLPNIHDVTWFLRWNKILKDLGLRFHYEQESFWRSGYWIASVKSLNFKETTHAIVMKGHQVFHDPSTKKRYRSGRSLLGKKKVVSGGWYIEVIDTSKLKRFEQWRLKLKAKE